MDSRARIRKQLGVMLGQTVWDNLWKYLSDNAYIDEVLDDQADMNYLTEVARKIILAVRGSETGVQAPSLLTPGEPGRALPTQRVNLTDFRMQVISGYLAKLAEVEVDVRLFRSKVLRDQLIAHKDVEDWINNQLSNEVMHAPSGSGQDKLNDLQVDSATPTAASSGTARWLEYSVPNNPFMRSASVAPGGVLARLYDAAVGVASKYPWKRSAATMFILTGLIPSVQAIEHSVETRVVALKGENRVALRRINLAIDPLVKPSEVHDYFRDVRKKILPRRQRAISEKHLRLAAFIIEQPKGGPWSHKMEAWNKGHPESRWKGYQYTKATNFQRDATAVINRLKQLMHEEYEMDGDRSEAPEFID
jgi:hypothetical protein